MGERKKGKRAEERGEAETGRRKGTLGIYPKELEICIHMKTCTRIFRAAFFIIVKATKMSFSS